MSDEKKVEGVEPEVGSASEDSKNAQSTPSEDPQNVPWVKATIEQKVERLHFVLKDLIKEFVAARKESEKTKADFFNHKHHDGQLMQIISQFGEAFGRQEEKDTRTEEEKWF